MTLDAEEEIDRATENDRTESQAPRVLCDSSQICRVLRSAARRRLVVRLAAMLRQVAGGLRQISSISRVFRICIRLRGESVTGRSIISEVRFILAADSI